ncbi:TLC domain protein (macronuclear) [Tetrahymena thermophila SB210]|uniref:TLC domain protein n=1 Tax=Tetrahymena thermophila (strain SB210) TaxID=312017 RepID=Q22YX7_TETTS|nr:TLC domain protein [Tetrahymena thermophila SB210]EAR90544.2 TLC domain protein [Tetrahymena thermophila SB210]|eukprot:XP_001010789.2 TLC domain protein [Tetrahymena thermophila SB210]
MKAHKKQEVQKFLVVDKDKQMNHIMISSVLQDSSFGKILISSKNNNQKWNDKSNDGKQKEKSNYTESLIDNKIQEQVQQINLLREQNNKSEEAQKYISKIMKKVRQRVLVKDFEPSFKFALAIILGIFFLFIKPAYSFRQWSREQQPIIETVELNYIFFSIIMIGLLSFTKQILKQIFYQWVVKNLNNKYKGILRNHRANKIILWIYETIYYFHMTLFGLITFNQATWMPYELGGKGCCNNLLKSFPNINQEDPQIINQMIYFNLIQLAFHVNALIDLFFGARKQDEYKKYETGLNHFMFLAIIIYSIFFNLLNMSTAFFILHNFGDIIVAGGRAYADLEQKQKKIIYLLITFGVSIWIFTRFFIVPKCIIFQFFTIIDLAQSFWSIFKYAYIYLLILFLFTLFMEIYWTLFLVQVSVSYILNPTYKNIYDNRDFKKLYQCIKNRNSLRFH